MPEYVIVIWRSLVKAGQCVYCTCTSCFPSGWKGQDLSSTQQHNVSVYLNINPDKILTLLCPLPHCSLRFSLRTRWTTRSDQRTVFTDSLHQYVCGLASPHCTAALVQLAKTSGGTGSQSWVQQRQALVRKLLKNLCHSNTLTGPKVEYKLKSILTE